MGIKTEKKKSVSELVALLEYQRKVLEEQDDKIGRNLYLATDVKEDENETNGS